MKFLITLLSSILVLSAYSQRNYSFYGFGTMMQSHYYNPAMGSEYRFSISLPLGMQSVGAANTGFKVNDVFVERSDDSLVFSPEKVLESMRKINFVDLNLETELFGAGLKIGKNRFTLSAISKVNLGLSYPKDFFVFALEGNHKSLLGKRADMDGFGINMNAYIEYAAGFSRELTDRLKVGGRVKLLSGIANFTTRRSELGLTTNEEDYTLTLDGALDVRTSGVFPLMEGADPMILVNNAYNFSNSGFAIDMGAQFKLTDRISLNSAINDLGSIKWNTLVENYNLDDFSYTFKGIDMNSFFKDSDSTDERFDFNLEESFKLSKSTESYRQVLPVRIVTGMEFKINKIISTYSTLFSDFQMNTYRPTLLIGGSISLRNWFKVTTNYMTTTNSFGNVGLGIMLRGLGTQFFISTDNILGPLNIAAHKNFHISTGISLTFGKPRNKD